MPDLSFNRFPYFDDYDGKKNFMRVLFKPGLNIQVRELNTIQSIFQDQIKRFASHFFKQGARITGGVISNASRKWVEIPSDSTITYDAIKVGQTMVSGTGVHSTILYKEWNESGKIAVFYHITTRDDPLVEDYVVGDSITISSTDSTITSFVTTEVKPGLLFTVGEGIFYFDGYFIAAQAQTCVVFWDNNNKSLCKIGFDVNDEIIDNTDDDSLNDNAFGYSSYGSPGADRYKIKLNLTTRTLDPKDGNKFITLASYTPYGMEYVKELTEYAELEDVLAQRTYEESGNYTLSPFTLRVLEHKASSKTDPLGWDVNGDPNNYVVTVSPNTCYVKGHRLKVLVETPVVFPKSSGTQFSSNVRTQFQAPAYFIARPYYQFSSVAENIDAGNSEFTNVVDLYNGPLNIAAPTGAKIGEAILGSVYLHSGVPGVDAEFKYLVREINMVAGHSPTEIKSLVSNNSFSANVVGEFYVENSRRLEKLLDVSGGLPIKSLKDSLGNGSVDMVARRELRGTCNGAGWVTFNTAAGETINLVDETIIIKDGATSNKALAWTELTFNPSRTQMNANIGVSHSTAEIVAFCNVDLFDVPIKTKTITSQTDTFTSLVGQTAFTLSKSDLISISSMWMRHKTDPLQDRQIMTDTFKVFNGQTNYAYVEAELTFRNGMSLDQYVLTTYNLEVNYEFYQHSLSEGVLTVDSYVGQSYQDIPVFVNADNIPFKLANMIDFRPLVINNLIMSPSPEVGFGSNVVYDIENYLPRVDVVFMNEKGKLIGRQGTPASKPKAPEIDAGCMKICELQLSPFSLSANSIIPVRIENKRYTMRDIEKIENRIKNMEYYTSLNLIERSAEQMSVKDANGLDRFKNGFIADDFSQYQAGDINSGEFQSALDRKQKELRPSFTARNRKLILLEAGSSNYQLHDNGVITLPYVEEAWINNPFATKSVSINPYFVPTKRGNMFLTPNIDTWADTTMAPAVNVSIDSGVDALTEIMDKAKLLGTEWGAWGLGNGSAGTAGNGVVAASAPERQESSQPQGDVVISPQPPAAASESMATVTRSIGSRTDSYSYDQISDVQLTTYIRPQTIRFECRNLMASTNHFAFFENKLVTDKCRPFSGNWGDPLVSDASGFLGGEFVIERGQFFVGQKEFILATTNDVEQLETDSNYSTAIASFYAGGLDVQKQEVNMSIISPTYTEVQTAGTSLFKNAPTPPDQLNITNITESTTTAVIDNITTIAAVDTGGGGDGGGGDPIAQSFRVDEDMFVTSLDLYFAAIDPVENDFWVSIRGMANGYPLSNNDDIMKIDLKTNLVNVDYTGLVPTRVSFPNPVFVEGGKEYCFVVGGWSPGTRVWVSKVGDPIVSDPATFVETQPTTGSSFRSQEGTTWNAEQYEDVKFIINRALFDDAIMNLTMVQQHDKDPLPEDPFEFEEGLNVVRLHCPDHGMNKGDAFDVFMFENEGLVIRTEDGQAPLPGQTLYSQNGRCKIATAVTDQLTNTIDITFTDMIGYIKTGDTVMCDTEDILSSQGEIVGRMSSIRGTVIEGNPESLANVPIENLVGRHVVETVDGPDSFIFEIDAINPPSSSGRTGGRNINISLNSKYEVCKVDGSYMLYGGVEDWKHIGVGHDPDNGVNHTINYRVMPEKVFTPYQNFYFEYPNKLANQANEELFVTSQHSIEIKGMFVPVSRYSSPIFNMNSFSVTTVSNHAAWIEEDRMAVPPNQGSNYVTEAYMNGSESYKYVTRVVSLKNPASDMVVAVDSYKDKDADFKIFYKMVLANEVKKIDDAEWIEIPITEKRDSADLTDWVAYEVTLSEAFGNAWLYPEYKQFKIKIIGRTKNSAKPPMFKNFRAIAVT